MPAGDVHGGNSWKKSEFELFSIVESSTWVFSFYVKNRAEKHSKRWKREQQCRVIGLVRAFFFQGTQKHGLLYPRVLLHFSFNDKLKVFRMIHVKICENVAVKIIMFSNHFG